MSIFSRARTLRAVEEIMRSHLLSATALSLLVASPAWATSTAALGRPQSTAGTMMAQAQTSRPQGAMMSEQDLKSTSTSKVTLRSA
jgi:hypothetical protein